MRSFDSQTALAKFESCSMLFEEELDYLHRTFQRLGAQPAEADDLAQEVFLVMWRRWADFQEGRPLRAWLSGIAHNVALDHFRKHSRREVATEGVDDVDRRPGPEEQLASARARHLALRALALLPDRHRTVLIEHDLDGLTIRQIAQQSAVPLFTAAARLRRARLRFAKLVRRLERQGHQRALLAAPLPRNRRRRPIRAMPRVVRPLPLVAVAAALGVLALLAFRPWPVAPQTAHALAAADGQAPARRTLALRPPRLLPMAFTSAATANPSSANPAESSLARGLVGHWAFEDGKGNALARDSSGNGRPCLLHDLDVDTAWVEGRAGGAIDLGMRGWLECPMPEARGGTPLEMSLAIWAKRVVRGRPEAALFTRQLPDGDKKHLFWFGVRQDQVTAWSYAWRGWTRVGQRFPSEWTHVALVHERTETRVYVDGVLVRHDFGQRPRGTNVPVQSSLVIGGTRYLPDPLQIRHHFDGLVDEARVYDRALTDAEVRALVD